MITLIKRWLEKRREKRLYPYKDCQPIINYDPIIIDLYIEIDECGHPFICTLEQKESREKKYNSPLQQAIRSRGGYL